MSSKAPKTVSTRTVSTKTLSAKLAITAAALTTAGALAATAAPAAAAPAFSTPAVNGIEIPPIAHPGHSFNPITVTAAPGPRPAQVGAPAVTTFRVPHLAKRESHHEMRYLVVDWRNLNTGKAGFVKLRYWQKRSTPNEIADNGLWRIPTSAAAATGSGPVVATVRIRQKTWNAPARDVQWIPGTIGIIAE